MKLTQEQVDALRGEERERYLTEGFYPRPKPLEIKPTNTDYNKTPLETCSICHKPYIPNTCPKCGGPMKWDMVEGSVDSYICEQGCDGVLDVHHVPKTKPTPEMGKESEYCALNDVLQERARQDAMWGNQNHDPLVYGAILTEEVGEFFQAALDTRFGGKNGGMNKMRLEAVQVAAVALAIIECLDRNKWEWGATITKNSDIQKDSRLVEPPFK